MHHPLLAALDWGTQLEGNVITYSFLSGGDYIDLEEQGQPVWQDFEQWNPYERQQAQLALAQFAAATQLTFIQADDPAQADLRFALYDFQIPNFLGWAVPPGEVIQGQPSGFAAFNVGSPLWSREAGGPLDQGGYSFITLVHELGHAFGLAHPHDDGGGESPLFPGVIVGPYHPQGSLGEYELNQGIFTMMSYRDGWVTNPAPPPPGHYDYGWSTGPMALDIAILQHKYGASESAGAPGTVYELADADGPGVGFTAIWNTYGDNVIRYQGDRDAVINLMPASLEVAWGGGGSPSFVQGVSGGFTIAHGVEVVTAISGDGDDVLIGNALDNRFEPGAGDNEVWGNGGLNTVVYTGTRSDYSIQLDDSGVWHIEADDESRYDLLRDARLLEFEDAAFYIEAVADSSLMVGLLYQGLFGRTPDIEGFLYWTVTAFDDDEFGSIARDMSLSAEFVGGRALLADDVFVETVYLDVLGREADAVGAAYWQDELASGAVGRGELVLSFGMSDEYDGQTLIPMLDTVAGFGDLWA